LQKLVKACGWKVLGDVTADSFCRWRENPIEQKQAESKDRKIGPVTMNQYLETLRSFGRWCVRRKRMANNPVADVEKVETSADLRRERRAFSEQELELLLAVVPEHHRRVYHFILATGLRRQEVEDLRWGDLHLSATVPFITLRAKATKSRRADALPLRADVAADLASIRGDAGDAEKVFEGVPTMDEHREYLTRAGIDWKDGEGRRADVHALRHTFGTVLSKSGASPREAMELMRHTEMSLTMKTYTDPRIFDLAGAVDRLPLPAVKREADADAARATGTDGAGKPSDGTAERVANRVARATRHRQSTATTDNQNDGSDSPEVVACGRDRQQKTPSGSDGAKPGVLGFEPRTR
jgi:integrase